MKDYARDLKLLKEEDIIWYIYYFIVTFAIIANSFEEKYIYEGNKNDRLSGRKINVVLLIIALLIYIYYVIIAIQDLNLSKSKDANRQRIAMERLITTLVFLVGGALSLYTELDDNAGDVDLAIF